ncbi:glutaredoxin-like domain-containing protein [Colletotrichum higginsianum]|uniref:Glutaredoxin-like protein n=1 Tax=Colletotrichum higginsianum (strain IMI 349063) TaxID=759273 RepID=H1W4S7_COLHI|nr:glutaredoxin-like domain-containing protein [Colletotrichum higginsianum]
MFTPTRRLFQKAHACRITLFARDGCGLCVRAKSALSNVWDRRPFAFTEINITAPDAKSWRDLYDFDVPVVRFASSPLAVCLEPTVQGMGVRHARSTP